VKGDAMKCKPGDMAVILSAFHESNVGRFVSVVKLYEGTGVYSDWAQPVWLVESKTPLTWTKRDQPWFGIQGPVSDAVLQPIRGLTGKTDRAIRLP
jgi:hypothetical protein